MSIRVNNKKIKIKIQIKINKKNCQVEDEEMEWLVGSDELLPDERQQHPAIKIHNKTKQLY